MKNFDKFYKQMAGFMREFNYKNSYIKERILAILYRSDEHLSAAQIQAKFSQIYKENISLPSIYELLNFLEDCALAEAYDESGVRKYELNLKPHHDHIICEICGKTQSFFDETIEQCQEKICQNKNFKLISHTMLLYGICEQCQNKQNDNDT